MQIAVVFLLLFGLCQSVPHEGFPILNPGGIGGIFKGPDSETIIRGPDGSEITSEEKGGAIVQDHAVELQPIIVPEPEPLVITQHHFVASSPAPSILAPPVIASTPSPLLTGETYSIAPQGYFSPPASIAPVPVAPHVTPVEVVQQDPHVIETEIIEAPDVEPEQSSDLKGPSGRIITKGSASVVSGPASTTITEPRKIVVAPPTIAISTPLAAPIPIKETSHYVPLPSAIVPFPTFSLPSSPTIGHLPTVSLEAGSTVAPPIYSYSTTAAPSDLTYSTVGASVAPAPFEYSKIDLGPTSYNRESIPVVEYSSSNGVISGSSFSPVISSTEAPIVSSTYSTTDNYASSPYLVPPVPSTEPFSSTVSENIQKIPKIEDTIITDGRVDMGDRLLSYRYPYQVPQVLKMALSRFYRKTQIHPDDKNRITIDDKMGELAQNEIAYETGGIPQAADLSQAIYLAPALAKKGIDPSQVNLAHVPLSQVIGLPSGSYQSIFAKGYLSNRYERQIKSKQ